MTKLASWYYAVWRDGIAAVQVSKSYLPLRERYAILLLMFSVAQALNMSTVFILLRPVLYMNLSIPDFGLGVFVNNFIIGFFIYIMPFIIINYIVIFHTGKFKQFINSTLSQHNGRKFMAYFVVSSVLFIGLLFVGKAMA